MGIFFQVMISFDLSACIFVQAIYFNILKGQNFYDDKTAMRRYNIYANIPTVGRYELMRENPRLCTKPDDEYWNECFTWQDLKKIIPYLKSQGWKFEIEAISKDQVPGKIHIFSFTYGVNHDFRIVNIAGMRIIMARDFGVDNTQKESLNPIGY
jgi:hypothetical protein